jgi:hypothetical protein
MIKVKTFTSELRIFQTMSELENLDMQVNKFLAENKIQNVIGISDTTTSDSSGATIGIIRALTYEEPE